MAGRLTDAEPTLTVVYTSPQGTASVSWTWQEAQRLWPAPPPPPAPEG